MFSCLRGVQHAYIRINQNTIDRLTIYDDEIALCIFAVIFNLL